MAFLALIRHGESEWNALDLWTGWTDVSLTQKGRGEAQKAAAAVQGISWDLAFTSALKRSVETLDEIKSILNLPDLPTISDKALDERDYGNFDGMNKVEIEEKYGEELFTKWHRGWDYPLPHGETLKAVYARVVPYYEQNILSKLQEGKNILVSAHGNSLRALIKYLENIPDAEIPYLEIATGEVWLYEIDATGKVVSRDVKKLHS